MLSLCVHVSIGVLYTGNNNNAMKNILLCSHKKSSNFLSLSTTATYLIDTLPKASSRAVDEFPECMSNTMRLLLSVIAINSEQHQFQFLPSIRPYCHIDTGWSITINKPPPVSFAERYNFFISKAIELVYWLPEGMSHDLWCEHLVGTLHHPFLICLEKTIKIHSLRQLSFANRYTIEPMPNAYGK